MKKEISVFIWLTFIGTLLLSGFLLTSNYYEPKTAPLQAGSQLPKFEDLSFEPPRFEDTFPLDQDVPRDAKPWEMNFEAAPQQSNPAVWDRPSMRQFNALRKAFSGDPMNMFSEDEKAELRPVLMRMTYPDQELKKHVLASYYSKMNHRETEFVFNNLDSIIEHFHGKKLSVDQAYNEVSNIFYGPVLKTDTLKFSLHLILSEIKLYSLIFVPYLLFKIVLVLKFITLKYWNSNMKLKCELKIFGLCAAIGAILLIFAHIWEFEFLENHGGLGWNDHTGDIRAFLLFIAPYILINLYRLFKYVLRLVNSNEPHT